MCTASRRVQDKDTIFDIFPLQNFDHGQIQTFYQDTQKTYSDCGLKRKKGGFTIFASLAFP